MAKKELNAFAECFLKFERKLMETSSSENIVNAIMDGLKHYYGFGVSVFYAVAKDQKDRYNQIYYAGSLCIGDDDINVLSGNFIAWHPEFVLNDNIATNRTAEFSFVTKCYGPSGISSASKYVYEQMLNKRNQPYEALLVIHQKSSHMVYAISVYKTREEGPFTDDEIWILEFIGKFLKMHTYNYQLKTDQATLISFLTDHLPLKRDGFCVIDNKCRPITQNTMFSTYMEDMFDGKPFKESVASLNPYARRSALWGEKEYTETRKGRSDTYQISLLADSVGREANRRKYLLIYIHPNSESAKKVRPAQPEDRENQYFTLMNEYNLTRRELEVLRLIVQGKDNSEIAETLSVSSATVKSHIRNIYGKLGEQKRSSIVARFRTLL